MLIADLLNEISGFNSLTSDYHKSVISDLVGKLEYGNKFKSIRPLGTFQNLNFYFVSFSSENYYFVTDTVLPNSPPKAPKEPVNDQDWKAWDAYEKAKKNIEKFWQTIKKSICGILSLSEAKNRWKAKEVSLSWLAPKLRGKGIGKKLYDLAIMNREIIISGQQQSKNSQALWKYFVAHPERYTVYTINMDSPKGSHELVSYDPEENDIDDEQLEKLYDGDYWKDWRMIVVKKK